MHAHHQDPGRRRAPATLVAFAAAIGRSALIASVVAIGCSREEQRSPSASESTVAAKRAEAWSATEPTPVRAVLIGIGDYPSDVEFPDLRGPRGDVELVRGLLVDRFHVDPGRIRTLLDSEATIDNIVRTVDEELLQKAETGEEALLFFSGHGSRVFDPTGLERGGRDSSLLAYDSRSDGRTGDYDLTDDVIFSLLHPLTQRGVHVTVITDACHSGGVVRGPFTPRSAPAGASSLTSVASWSTWPRDVPFLDDDERQTREELTNYVHVSACSPEQKAYEYAFAKDGPHGLLTWALADVLRHARPTDTYRDLAVRASARIDALPGAPPQSIWVEGPEAQRELFSRRFQPPSDGFDLRVDPDGGDVEVVAGSVHGVRRGTVLEARDEDGTRVGRLTVEVASFGGATARWDPTTPALAPDKALRAQIVAQPADLPKLQVHCADASLRGACASSAWADVDDDEMRPYVVESRGDGQVLFRTAEGIPIWAGPRADPGGVAEPDAAIPLEAAFRKETRFAALWRLADPDARGELHDLELALTAPNEAELRGDSTDPRSPTLYAPVTWSAHGVEQGFAVRGADVTAGFDAELPTYEETSSWPSHRPLATLEITNGNSCSVYVHVVSLNEAREVQVLFPPPGVKDRPSTMSTPTKRVSIELGAMSAAAFPFERPMHERYLVIASQSPLDLEGLEQRTEVTKSTSRGALPGVLRACLGGGMTPSRGVTEHPERGWGVAWVDVWITRSAPR